MLVIIILLKISTMGNKTGNIRWGIGLLLFFVSALNYLDRQVLSVIAPTLQRELGLTDIDYSYITSSFLFSYTIMYAISGYLVDKWGTRKSFLFFAGGWSIANILHGFAKNLIQLCSFRFFLGATESGNFPAGVKAASEWFPMKERALAIGLLNAGSSIGAAIAVPLVSMLTIFWGWQGAFVVTGLLGFVWVFFWQRNYFTPSTHPRISKEELAYIEEEQQAKMDSNPKISIGHILRKKQAWGCFIARILIDPCTYFLIFWIPKYLQDKQGMSLTELGYFAWMPYVALAIGTISGGIIPKKLINLGWTLDKARKTTMLAASLLVPLCCALLFSVSNWFVAILSIAGVMFGHGLWGNITIPSEVFPKQIQGTITGLGGFLGGATSILTQITIGWTIQNSSYLPVFIFVGISYLITLIGVQALIGKLGKVITF